MPSDNAQSSQRVRRSKAIRREDPERRTLSVEEAGRILGISRGSAYSAARKGELPVIKLGGRFLVIKAALEKLLQGA